MTGIFDNVTSMVVNNKDVASLKIGNDTIWQKTSPATKIATHFTVSGSYLYLRDANNTGLASKTVKRYRNGSLNSTLTTNSNGRVSYSSRYTYQFEGDSTYEACSYP